MKYSYKIILKPISPKMSLILLHEKNMQLFLLPSFPMYFLWKISWTVGPGVSREWGDWGTTAGGMVSKALRF